MFIKICGVTNENDALLAAGLGADAIGLNFVGTSKRRISVGTAYDIVRRLPPEVLTVGIFRDEHRERVIDIAHRAGVRAVQLHGHESPEDTRWVAERVPNVLRALSITDPAIDHLDAFGDVRFLIDAPEPGSGETFDWSSLSQRSVTAPFLLAGGLHPDNVGEAIQLVRPWGVDVASGVESRSGEKDPAKLQRFIANARAADPRRDTTMWEPLDAE